VLIGHDLTAAPVAPMVLTILLGGDRSGYEIVGRVREMSEGHLGWPDSMAYPMFHRLRRLGYITADWRDMPGGTRRRSKAALTSLGVMWKSFVWLSAT
jgi:PadR family transcriptional regulator PadR